MILDLNSVGRKEHSPPQMSAPLLPVLSRRLLLIENKLYATADKGQRILQNRHLIISGHVFARQLELFLLEDQWMELVSEYDTYQLFLDWAQFFLCRSFVHRGAKIDFISEYIA